MQQAFRDFQQELMKLYKARNYLLAYELVLRNKPNFPDRPREMGYWHMCLATLTENQAEALQVFREVLDCGYWFAPDWLKEDPDLMSLRETASFQGLVEICQQRLAAARNTIQPEIHVRFPEQQEGAFPLLIALHGNGSNASHTLDSWEDITKHGWCLAVPRSTQVVGYDAFVWDDREQATREILAHLVALTNTSPPDLARVVLGGFSMGGGQAIWMAFHRQFKTPGFVAFAPYLREGELETLASLLHVSKPEGLRGYIIVGEEDTQCVPIASRIVELMQNAGLPCKLERKPGLGHTYPPDFLGSVTRGLAFIEQRVSN